MAGRSGPSWVGLAVPLVLSCKAAQNWCVGLLLEISFFRWVAPLLQPGVVGAFLRYGVYDSLALCRWKESIVSISTSRNWRLVVLG
jgi:hypothetical protein